ncbi:hypothetical protein HNQ60_005320 [Povalibacter uvarum]|uniref:Uncharacterized protein n=1 Tax=Povalibacter uvarum TaxID=732238 RepID=A0A841HWV2_9GAMM|nr:hypothetical protein [Povalibacter uvarum]MBB6096398.1 hypothetical protein [Povalibacter uvarum]
MKVAYSAVGITVENKPILGHVIVESDATLQTSGISYKIDAWHFASEGLIYSGGGAASDKITILRGPTPDKVSPSGSRWRMGQWQADSGVVFKGVDNAALTATTAFYQRLPPRIELQCDFTHDPPYGPFQPKGWLKLIWNPQFVMLPGVKTTFFSSYAG